MKALLVLILMVPFISIAASSYELKRGDYGLRAIYGNLTKVEPLCPVGMTCFTNGTVLTLDFALNGCFDRLGPVTYLPVHDQVNKTVTLYVSAINILNKKSQNALCYRRPVESFTITMINKFYKDRDIKLRFLGTAETNPNHSW